MKKAAIGLALSGLVSTVLMGCGGDGSSSGAAPQLSTKAALGEQLYSDKNLSFDGTQSCATCHNPDKGFIDDRTNDASRDIGKGLVASAGSLGDNGTSIGDRQAPSAAYASFSPLFHEETHDRPNKIMSDLDIGPYTGFVGGQFWDGREADLKGQAGGPPTNPDEMNMPDKASVVERIKENAEYVAGFEHVYGGNIFDDVDLAYAAMAESIGEFEKEPEFATFDSKYDRTFLSRNDENFYEFSSFSKALTGQVLFFSSNLTCAACHQQLPLRVKGEVFTSFEYHNIGVPVNVSLRSFNGATALDEGLLNNPGVTAESEKGKFKVPTLRNVAVTAPYMHNGIFNELETVIRFYQHAKEKILHDVTGSEIIVVNNPETGAPWGGAEINQNIANDILISKQPLGDGEVEALVCFFMSLTDARYEYLLDPAKVESCSL